jgi:hypothetical protein
MGMLVEELQLAGLMHGADAGTAMENIESAGPLSIEDEAPTACSSRRMHWLNVVC